MRLGPQTQKAAEAPRSLDGGDSCGENSSTHAENKQVIMLNRTKPAKLGIHLKAMLEKNRVTKNATQARS